jgi:adenylyl-sulfate kinase
VENVDNIHCADNECLPSARYAASLNRISDTNQRISAYSTLEVERSLGLLRRLHSKRESSFNGDEEHRMLHLMHAGLAQKRVVARESKDAKSNSHAYRADEVARDETGRAHRDGGDTLVALAPDVPSPVDRQKTNIHWQQFRVDRAARTELIGHRPRVIWLTGLSGAGKSTIANLAEQQLNAFGRHTYLLDGDNIRHGLNRDLGFSKEDRVENIRRLAEVARLMADAGLIVFVAAISPFRADRTAARQLIGEADFIEVFVDVPLKVAEARDPKGLYKKVRAGQLPNLTGLGSPYEPPENPELHLDATRPVEELVSLVLDRIEQV